MLSLVDDVQVAVQTLQTWTTFQLKLAELNVSKGKDYTEILLLNTGEIGYVKSGGAFGYFKDDPFNDNAEIELRGHGGVEAYPQGCCEKKAPTTEYLLNGCRRVVFRCPVKNLSGMLG